MSIIARVTSVIGGTPITRTYAKWNSADKASGITLSSDELTAFSVSPARALRANMGKSSGKWYWEVTPSTNPSYAAHGVGKTTAPLTEYPGYTDANGWSYIVGTGKTWNSGTATSISGYDAGAVETVGVALDMDTGTVKYYRTYDGSVIATVTGLTGTIYPMAAGGVSVINVTANFGQSAFVGLVPSGYSTGLFT